MKKKRSLFILYDEGIVRQMNPQQVRGLTINYPQTEVTITIIRPVKRKTPGPEDRPTMISSSRRALELYVYSAISVFFTEILYL